jgi:hypothetical protein
MKPQWQEPFIERVLLRSASSVCSRRTHDGGCIYSLDLIEEDVRWNDLVRTEFEKRSA